jgi:hypothetical protein
VALLLLGAAATPARAQEDPKGQDAAVPAPETHWWSGLLVSPGFSLRNEKVTLGSTSHRAQFETTAGNPLEGYHVQVAQGEEARLPYYLEFSNFHLTRQRLIKATDASQSSGQGSSQSSGQSSSQSTDSWTTRDLGTEIRGFYLMGGREFALGGKELPRVISALRLGIGLGLGVTEFDGTVRYASHLKEANLENRTRGIHTGLVPGVSFELFGEWAKDARKWGWPEAIHGFRIRFGGGAVYAFVGGADIIAEFLRLSVDLQFQL